MKQVGSFFAMTCNAGENTLMNCVWWSNLKNCALKTNNLHDLAPHLVVHASE